MQAGKLIACPFIPLLNEHNVRTGFFEPQQSARVQRHLPPHMRGIAAFAFVTGWRTPSEILPLEWRQVDLKQGEVRLDAGATKTERGACSRSPSSCGASSMRNRNRHGRKARARDDPAPCVLMYERRESGPGRYRRWLQQGAIENSIHGQVLDERTMSAKPVRGIASCAQTGRGQIFRLRRRSAVTR